MENIKALLQEIRENDDKLRQEEAARKEYDTEGNPYNVLDKTIKPAGIQKQRKEVQ